MFYNSRGEACGLIYNIQGYTIHDGPGIRTELFFKGCPLHCPWCSNPESISTHAQLGVYPTKCLGKDKCGYCISDCPLEDKPICFDGDGILLSVDEVSQCKNCLKCADSCPAGAIKVWGELKTIPEIMKILERDRSFYERSGGGVTVSGGEALLQWEFVAKLLEECKRVGIGTCLESAMFVPTAHLDAVLPHTDLLITDIKFFDSDRHRECVGTPNELILENIAHAAEMGVPIVLRTPVVMGRNDDWENIREIGRFAKERLGDRLVQYQLLPYRKLGTEKYASLNQPYPMGDYEPPEREVWEKNLLKTRDMLKEEFGLPVSAGTSENLPPFSKK